MPEITVLIYTARNDRPFAGKAEGLHCFEPVARTLAAQSFQDFELVVVDALWESRRSWFEDNPQPFAVKHVPSQPNYWQDRGRPGLSAQLNRGFVWADGRYVWMGDEKVLFPPHFLGLAAELFHAGTCPSAWYALADRHAGAHDPNVPPGPCPPADFDMLGFTRDDVFSVDHRAARFLRRDALQAACHPHNFYGYSGVPLEVAVAVNGFDQLMDGQMALQDCDFGTRLGLAGASLVMHRDLYVISTPVARAKGYFSPHKAFKCNYAIQLYNELTRRRVNTALPAGYVEEVQGRVCRGACHLGRKCRAGSEDPQMPGRIGESDVYPFCGGEQEALARQWFGEQPLVELGEEIARRKAGEVPYDRVTVGRRRRVADMKRPILCKEHFNQWLVDTFGFDSYLEIGCYQDGSFNMMQCARKVGVDPNLGGTVRMTSDEFFAQNEEKFDLVFIDGNHDQEFVFRDIDNALKCLTPRGLITVHDCYPPDLSYESVARCGTGWRALAHYRQSPDLDIAVGDFDVGVGVVVRRPNSSPVALDKVFTDLTYAEMTPSLMRLLPVDKLQAFVLGQGA